MDVETLARIQFAMTSSFHYIYPPLSIGIGLALVIMESFYLYTKDPLYETMAKFWTKIFALTFSIGVATGIVLEFEFGTNWATYSRYVGDIFGSALAAEGIFAFFLESGFLAILLFGWDRVGPKTHFFATLMVCLGSHFSAVWIIIANSWMQTPAGYHIVGEGLTARAEITDFWAMVFNPSSMERLAHTIVGAWLAGAFLVISVAAYYILKQRHLRFAQNSLKIGLAFALFSCVLQGILGDISAKSVGKNQPAKLAAFEALYETQKNAPLHLFGLVNSAEERVDGSLSIPSGLSFLIHNSTGAEVIGLDQFPKKDWPNVAALFQIYRLMIGMWILMLGLSLVALYKLWKGTLSTSKWTLRLLVVSVAFPQLANQAGWFAAEMGRYPWIVYGLLRISEGLSKAVTEGQVLFSLILFFVLYSFLFALFIFLMDRKIKAGPTDYDQESPYHHLHAIVEDK